MEDCLYQGKEEEKAGQVDWLFVQRRAVRFRYELDPV
jgi:hypothetical protein